MAKNQIKSPKSSDFVGYGTVNQPTTGHIAVSHEGYGPYIKTTLVLNAVEITITDALAYVGTKIYDFPDGVLRVLDSAAALTLTTTSVIADTLNSGVTVNWGLGTVTASAATLATTMIDVLPGSGGTLPAFTSSTTINEASATDVDYMKHADAQDIGAIWDGSSTAKDLYLNLAVPTATDIDADATVEVDGKIVILWSALHNGDLT